MKKKIFICTLLCSFVLFPEYYLVGVPTFVKSIVRLHSYDNKEVMDLCKDFKPDITLLGRCYNHYGYKLPEGMNKDRSPGSYKLKSSGDAIYDEFVEAVTNE